MLTWAMAWYSVKSKGYNGLWFIAAICGDCYIAWAIGSAVAGRSL